MTLFLFRSLGYARVVSLGEARRCTIIIYQLVEKKKDCVCPYLIISSLQFSWLNLPTRWCVCTYTHKGGSVGEDMCTSVVGWIDVRVETYPSNMQLQHVHARTQKKMVEKLCATMTNGFQLMLQAYLYKLLPLIF